MELSLENDVDLDFEDSILKKSENYEKNME